MRAVKPAAADALASAARQLQYALDESATIDAAFQKLYAMVDPQRRATLQQLESLLRSPEPDAAASKNLRLSPFPTLAWLLHQTPEPGRSAAALFAEFRRHQSFSATGVAVLWSEFAGFLSYLIAVLCILIVVVMMYGLVILPQFKSLYRGFGVPLPTLTSAMFGSGFPLFTFALLLAFGFLAFVTWFVFTIRRQLRRYAPMPAGHRRTPFVGKVALAYNQYLWLSYAGLLCAARMPADQALKVAASRLPQLQAGQWDSALAAPGLMGDLSVASRLGKLDPEVQHQQDATVDAFLVELARCRRRVRIVLTILVYLLVAVFVSGMYLPIFSLGSAI